MSDRDIFNKAKEIIGEENIIDCQPAIFMTETNTMLDGIECPVPNTLMIWLANGDVIWYRATDVEE